MPSSTPKGELISQLRRSLGYTQLELAARVGVSERTVRNAERGHAIRHDFLKFIAGGLGVTLPDVTQASDHSSAGEQRQPSVARLLTGLGALLTTQDPACLLDLVAHDIVLRRDIGLPGMAFGLHLFGEFRGKADVARLLEGCCQFWQACGPVDYYVEFPVGGGDVVVLRYGHEVPLRNGATGWARSVVICEFEGETLVRVDEHFMAGSGPPERNLLPHCTRLGQQHCRFRRPHAG